jgi:hypothetical protein
VIGFIEEADAFAILGALGKDRFLAGLAGDGVYNVFTMPNPPLSCKV